MAKHPLEEVGDDFRDEEIKESIRTIGVELAEGKAALRELEFLKKSLEEKDKALAEAFVLACKKAEDHAGDYEGSHKAADMFLVKVLRCLGYERLCMAFEELEKWYA